MTTIPPNVIAANDWRAYSAGTPETEARESYVTRIGTQPLIVGLDQWGRDVLAGPVPSAIDAHGGV